MEQDNIHVVTINNENIMQAMQVFACVKSTHITTLGFTYCCIVVRDKNNNQGFQLKGNQVKELLANNDFI